MNSFTVTAVGNLAKNPELTVKGDTTYTRFCLVGNDYGGKDEQGNVVLDSRQFLADNLVYPAAHFDVVLCWNLPDYLHESLVRPVVGRLWSVLKPGGMLLALLPLSHRGPGFAGNAAHRDAEGNAARSYRSHSHRDYRGFSSAESLQQQAHREFVPGLRFD